MRFTVRLTLVSVAVALLLLGCSTMSSSGSSGSGDMVFLSPDDLIDNTIIGTSDGEGSFDALVFRSDETFEITIEGSVIVGTWEYKPDTDLMAYTLDWEVNGERQGYLTSITLQGESVLIMGHWYVTDMNKTWYASGAFES